MAEEGERIAVLETRMTEVVRVVNDLDGKVDRLLMAGTTLDVYGKFGKAVFDICKLLLAAAAAVFATNWWAHK